jgi:toxin-antitoxin system PIN domain toxin
MSHLLDVNVLLAAIWTVHSQHTAADAWLKGKRVAVCPLSELGFLRISTNPKAPFNVSMSDARKALEKFLAETSAARIADDLPALDSQPKTSDEVTDHYLADLAQSHELKLATFDTELKHPVVEVIGG